MWLLRTLLQLFFTLTLLVPVTSYSPRKSLRFGPHNPSVKYFTQLSPTAKSIASDDPFEVAKFFLLSHNVTDYFIRSDSYVDRITGVAYVYIRQIFDGLEVSNGDINLNIRDGYILSYGDSFYRGLPPTSASGHHPLTTHNSYCSHFEENKLISSDNQAQITLAYSFNTINHFFLDHCTRPLAASLSVTSAKVEPNLHDPRWAALHFMLLAHPEMDAVDDLTQNFDTHLDRMSVTFQHAAADPDGRPTGLGGVIFNLPGAISPVEFRQVYFQIPTEHNQTELHIVWRMEVEMLDNWYEAYVSASDPKSVLSVVDWVSDSRMPQLEAKFESNEIELNGNVSLAPQSGSYKVWKWGINDPGSGNRSIEKAWHDRIASPLGWHTISRAKNPDNGPDWIDRQDSQYDNQTYLHFTSTWGNNVFAQENWGRRDQKDWTHKYRPDAGHGRNFVYDYCHESGLGHTPDCSPRDYVNVSVTQLFYTVNMVHDLYYRYGFDEASGNFQQDNHGRGGRDNDAVIAYAQDGSSSNNARFTTPPDGKHGRCHMYLWDYVSPARDSDFDAGTLIHELTHGLSNRLTGGPANSGCLGFGESGGLGEGWGDFLATTIRSTQYGGHGDFAIGDWVSGDIRGVRYYLYSTNRTVNPQTYATMNKPRYWGEHEIGEIWAEALWIVMEGLVRKYGFSSTLFPPQPLDDESVPTGDFYRSQAVGKPLVPRHGNTLMVQLVILAMKLQPCRPSFFDARDAIIEADRVLTGGENFCELWVGFSLSGLGMDASLRDADRWGGGVRRNGFKVPTECSLADSGSVPAEDD